MLDNKRVLFIGLGKSTVLWYRMALPATHLGADWVGVGGTPPGLSVVTGVVKGDTALPNYEDYDVVVVQQAHGRAWLKLINSLKERGIKVIYEIDDYLHGVSKQTSHDYGKDFTKDRLKSYEMCMRACDAMICSTHYIARRYAKFNRNVHVCRNGIDAARYRLTIPERSIVVPGGVSELPLMRGDKRVGSTFVDEGDLSLVAPYRWGLHEGGYAVTSVGGENVYLHRLLLEPGELVVDHKNTDKLDNRRANLELVTDAENKQRRMFQEGAAHRGARPGKNGKWSAYVDTPSGRQWLGHTHTSEEEARVVVAKFRAEYVTAIQGPERIKRSVSIGWAGATGHAQVVFDWLNVMLDVLRKRPNACIVTIGQLMVDDAMNSILHANRTISIPFAPLECYPAAMCMFDIALAPAGQNTWYRGKSDLRWLEASALGIPTVADPVVYPEIEHGVTGFHVETPGEAAQVVDELVGDEDLRRAVGKRAQDHVLNERTSDIAAMAWSEVLAAVHGGYTSVHAL